MIEKYYFISHQCLNYKSENPIVHINIHTFCLHKYFKVLSKNFFGTFSHFQKYTDLFVSYF